MNNKSTNAVLLELDKNLYDRKIGISVLENDDFFEGCKKRLPQISKSDIENSILFLLQENYVQQINKVLADSKFVKIILTPKGKAEVELLKKSRWAKMLVLIKENGGLVLLILGVVGTVVSILTYLKK